MKNIIEYFFSWKYFKNWYKKNNIRTYNFIFKIGPKRRNNYNNEIKNNQILPYNNSQINYRINQLFIDKSKVMKIKLEKRKSYEGYEEEKFNEFLKEGEETIKKLLNKKRKRLKLKKKKI